MADLIDLFGWDTVFAIHYDHLNKVFEKNDARLPDFTRFLDAGSGVDISGSWNFFQVTTGGSGQDLQMMCKLKSASSSMQGDFTGAWLKIQVNLAAIPNPQFPAKDKAGSGGTVHTLQVKSTGTDSSPAVSIISSDFPKITGILKSALPSIFQSYFIANIAQFNQVFTAVDLNVMADKEMYQWLKPSSVSYACADTVGGQLQDGVFAVLCKTDNGDSKGLSQQVDSRILQSLPAGSNSALAISAKKVLEHIFMQGAINTLHGSKREDFDTDNDNLWIINRNDLTWGNFTLDDGEVISPVIKAKNFQLGLVGQTVQMQIIDATAKLPDWKGSGEIDLHMSITQHFEFELKQKANGDYVFVPKLEKDHTSVKEIVTSISVSEGVIIMEICLGIGMAIIGAVVGGAIGGAVDASMVAIADSGEEAVITISEEAVENAINEVTEEVMEEAEQEAASSAAEAMENVDDPGFLSKFKSAITANKWKLFGGAVGGFITFPVGMASEFITLIAEGKLENIPPFNEFSTNVTGATTFPGSTGWDLKSAGLNGPLVITGDLKSADN